MQRSHQLQECSEFVENIATLSDILQTYDSIPSERVSNLALVVPSVQQSVSGVVVHHGIVAVLVGELYVGVPLCSCLGVVSVVNGSRISQNVVDKVNHSTGHKGVSYRPHLLCFKQRNKQVLTPCYILCHVISYHNTASFSNPFLDVPCCARPSRAVTCRTMQCSARFCVLFWQL